MAHGEQGRVQSPDRAVDPGVLAILPLSRRAAVQDRLERRVDADVEGFGPHGPAQAAGDVEGVQRYDAPLVRLDDEDARIVARLGHRKHAPGVTGQQVLGAETAERPAGAEIGVGQASPF